MVIYHYTESHILVLLSSEESISHFLKLVHKHFKYAFTRVEDNTLRKVTVLITC